MRTLHWFRRDLRAQDNTALYHASHEASDGMLSVFIFCPKTWQQHNMSSAQVKFMLHHLQQLQHQLDYSNIPLLILKCNTFNNVPKVLTELVKRYNIDAVYFNEEYEVNELLRDEKVKIALEKIDCKVNAFCDQVIVPPNTILNKTEQPYKVFTPFSKQWLSIVSTAELYRCHPAPKKQSKKICEHDKIPSNIVGFDDVDVNIWIEDKDPIKQLEKFCIEQLYDYEKNRDFPSINGTSQLSPHLAIGTLSPRQCIEATYRCHGEKNIKDALKHKGAKVWINEIIWREFYKYVLVHFPKVCRGEPFQALTKKLKWRNDKKAFQQWCDGQTGFPIIDAAMRQLNQTHWMHNRLRMIAAMFLSKILFLDWRLGEQYFMQHLIDGDFSANNGGWQWSASTGTDAVPYFRIFNPTRQSQRFDADGAFIRQFCPELKDLDDRQIHLPYKNDKLNNELDYPKPIVDYAIRRQETIAAFKSLKTK